jgi:hypothetical protein
MQLFYDSILNFVVLNIEYGRENSFKFPRNRMIE